MKKDYVTKITKNGKITTYSNIWVYDSPSEMVDPRDVNLNRVYTGKLMGPFTMDLIHNPLYDEVDLGNAIEHNGEMRFLDFNKTI